MDMDTETIIILLCIALGIAILVGVLFFASSRRSGRRYTRLTNEIAEAEEAERETARRRRVSKAMKQHVMKRDHYTCQICGISKGYLDAFVPGLGDFLLLEIDHIVPVAKGGSGDDESNLQVLCWRCNLKKGKKYTNAEVKAMIDYGRDRLG